jgi:hypothetical protein
LSAWIACKSNILPAAHAITKCDSTSSLFGIGKQTVFKVLNDSPENFRDVSTLADCDTDKSIDAASKLVCRLYDQKVKLKEDHIDINKLRDACLAKLPPSHPNSTAYFIGGFARWAVIQICICSEDCKTC